ncbi:MAG: SDR family oxidoreductase [Deltaproteobacteria bacterium]|jgi:NAD(P)-dependent dehydrogenase (short-subunit alcohol dehydrogenase family)|nr:SDR family oxidoreductase [Deltaproteobacteria bacterium]
MSKSKFDLSGKVALVTGGNGGIGLGMAAALAEAGADVCIWGRNADKNRAAEDTLKSYGHKVLALTCDISNQNQVQENYKKTLESMGHIDACFANAGIGSFGTPFHDMSIDEWRTIFGINMEGVFFTFQSAVRHMMERGQGGSLVVTSSLSARAGIPRAQHYAAAKAGVIAMVQGLAVEYARYGIRANAILPGWIETDMTNDVFNWDKFVANVMPRVPARRWGLPADFGPIAVYFASDASEYHTGDAVVIDGGFSKF